MGYGDICIMKEREMRELTTYIGQMRRTLSPLRTKRIMEHTTAS